MSNLVNMTINLEGWSNERVIQLLNWIEETDDSYTKTPETFEGQKEVSAEIHQDLVEVKKEIDTINNISRRQEENISDEVLNTSIEVIVGMYGSTFNTFFRRFVQKTQAELIEVTKGHDATNKMVKALHEKKGGVSLANVSEDVQRDLVSVLLKTRKEHKLPLLLEEDLAILEIAADLPEAA